MSVMDQNFREFLTLRDATLREREEKLRSQLEELKGDLKKIVDERDEIHLALNYVTDIFHRDIKPSNLLRPTIKQAVVTTLEKYNRPMGALEILEKLKEDFDMNYERTSLSPQLSRLKAEEKISLERGLWSLKK